MQRARVGVRRIGDSERRWPHGTDEEYHALPEEADAWNADGAVGEGYQEYENQ